MKTKLIIIGLLLFSFTGIAQSNIMSKYFDKYADDESFTKVTINSKMFSLFTNLDAESEDEKDFVNAISKIKGLKILACDSVADAEKIYKNACAEIDKEGYEELMTVEDANENMKFSIIEKDGKIEELLMVVGGKKKFVLLTLYGEIDLKNVSKIARSMNINGLENLNKIDHVKDK